jgi:ketosteroid isomerase-like protein
MRRVVVLAAATLALAGVALAGSRDLQADFAGLVAAERAFAAMGAAKGIKESFLANIAGDGVLFRPGPVPGKEFLAAHPNPPVSLAWGPSYAEIARSGDLGWTTGPYEIAAPGQPKGHGQFSTVWKRQADGSWKFLADLGVECPSPPPSGEPALRPEALAAAKESAPQADPDAARESLLAAELDLEKAAAQGVATAYAAVAADDVHLLRDGHLPFVGREAVRGALAGDPGRLSWQATGSGVSAAGDLGYTFGTAARQDPAEEGAYMRVWKRRPGGPWQLALDVLKLAASKVSPAKPGP